MTTDALFHCDTNGKRTEQALEARSQELQTLYEISQTILSSLDIKTVLEKILDRALSSGSFDIGVIRLLDASGQILEPIASHGFLEPKNIRIHRMRDVTTGKVISRVMTWKEPYVVEKVANSDGLRTFKQEGVESAIIIPVRAEEKVLGVIQLGSRTQKKLQDGEIHLLKTIGSQMGIAVQKARLYGETQRNLERIRALREIDLALSSTLDLHDVLNILIEKLDVLLPHTAILVWLLDGDKGLLECVACSNLVEGERKDRELGGTLSLAKIALQDTKVVVASNLQTDPRTIDVEFYRRHGLVSYLGVPLLAKGEALGVLIFLAKEEHRFTNEEIEFLTMVAGQAATAIHNSQLYEQIKNQAVELEKANKDLKRKEETQTLLKELSQDITTLNIDNLLKRLTEKICEFLKADLSDVRLLEGETWQLRGVSGIDLSHLPQSWTSSTSARKRSIWVRENRKPLLIPDITKGPIKSTGNVLESLGIHGFLGVPIFSRGGKVIGILRALTCNPRHFTQEEVDLMEQLAGGAAIAVENARLFEKVQQTSRELEALVKINRDIAALLDRNILLPRIVEEAKRLLKMDGANFRLIEGEYLELYSALHRTDINFRQRLRLGESLSGKVIEENRMVAIRNLLEDPTIIEEHREKLCNAGYRSYLGIPLGIGTRVIGAINLLSRKEREFSSEEVSLVSSFAAQAAIAVENAQLYEQIQKQAVELEKDIVKRKRAEVELKKLAAELERSNRELQEFAAVASHDLQEPLRKILAFGDRLKTKCGEVLSDEGRDYLQRMQNASGRMQNLINDLLTYSRVTTKARPFVPVDLSEATREVLADLEIRIAQTGGRVEVGDLPTIDADPTQMRQLLQNLIGNALKFHRPEEPPVVRIHGQLVNGREGQLPDSSLAGELCQITVQDNGIGFEEKYRDRIFNVFQRLHSRSDYEGSGIGLAVCRKIARRHGGDITATSAPGEGATFIVKLPIEHPKGENTQWMNVENQSNS